MEDAEAVTNAEEELKREAEKEELTEEVKNETEIKEEEKVNVNEKDEGLEEATKDNQKSNEEKEEVEKAEEPSKMEPTAEENDGTKIKKEDETGNQNVNQEKNDIFRGIFLILFQYVIPAENLKIKKDRLLNTKSSHYQKLSNYSSSFV